MRCEGSVREDARSPGGFEMGLTALQVLGSSPEYPIQPKEHGVEFLLDHRHLWLRSSQQRAGLKVRAEVEQAIHDFLYNRDFVRIDTPILTGAIGEHAGTLFETDYFGESAYLAQTGQLYAEAACPAFRNVYCFGPTFRAEKSKTRRHLTEFWMIEPEMAFVDSQGNMELPGGVGLLPRGAGTGTVPAGAGVPGTGSVQAGERPPALSPDQLHRRGGATPGEGQRRRSGGKTSEAPTRRF